MSADGNGEKLLPLINADDTDLEKSLKHRGKEETEKIG